MKKSLLTICVVLLGLPCVALAGSNSTGASWCIQEGDAISSEDVYSGSSLALDSDGKAHISYSVNGALQYATNKSGTWEAETVDATENARFYSSILPWTQMGRSISAIDDYTNGDLKYATNMSGTWETEIVDSEGDTGVVSFLRFGHRG